MQLFDRRRNDDERQSLLLVSNAINDIDTAGADALHSSTTRTYEYEVPHFFSFGLSSRHREGFKKLGRRSVGFKLVLILGRAEHQLRSDYYYQSRWWCVTCVYREREERAGGEGGELIAVWKSKRRGRDSGQVEKERMVVAVRLTA